MQNESKFDPVNRPEHYIYGPECIEAMVAAYGAEAVINFCICNAFKYFWRHDKKNGSEDIEKGLWYSRKGLELLNEGTMSTLDIEMYTEKLVNLRNALASEITYIPEE